jgi:hypothetical protein
VKTETAQSFTTATSRTSWHVVEEEGDDAMVQAMLMKRRSEAVQGDRRSHLTGFESVLTEEAAGHVPRRMLAKRYASGRNNKAAPESSRRAGGEIACGCSTKRGVSTRLTKEPASLESYRQQVLANRDESHRRARVNRELPLPSALPPPQLAPRSSALPQPDTLPPPRSAALAQPGAPPLPLPSALPPPQLALRSSALPQPDTLPPPRSAALAQPGAPPLPWKRVAAQSKPSKSSSEGAEELRAAAIAIQSAMRRKQACAVAQRKRTVFFLGHRTNREELVASNQRGDLVERPSRLLRAQMADSTPAAPDEAAQPPLPKAPRQRRRSSVTISFAPSVSPASDGIRTDANEGKDLTRQKI